MVGAAIEVQIVRPFYDPQHRINAIYDVVKMLKWLDYSTFGRPAELLMCRVDDYQGQAFLFMKFGPLYPDAARQFNKVFAGDFDHIA